MRTINVFSLLFITVFLASSSIAMAEGVFVVEKVDIKKGYDLDEKYVTPWFSEDAKNITLTITDKASGTQIYKKIATHPGGLSTYGSFQDVEQLKPLTEYAYTVTGESATGQKAEKTGAFKTDDYVTKDEIIAFKKDTDSIRSTALDLKYRADSNSQAFNDATKLITSIDACQNALPVVEAAVERSVVSACTIQSFKSSRDSIQAAVESQEKSKKTTTTTPTQPTQTTSGSFRVVKVDDEEGYNRSGRYITPWFSDDAKTKNITLVIKEKISGIEVYRKIAPPSDIPDYFPNYATFTDIKDLKPLKEYIYTVSGDDVVTGQHAESSGSFTTKDFFSESDKKVLQDELDRIEKDARSLKQKAKSADLDSIADDISELEAKARECDRKIPVEEVTDRTILKGCDAQSLKSTFDSLKDDVDSFHEVKQALKSKADIDAALKLIGTKGNQNALKVLKVDVVRLKKDITSRRDSITKASKLFNEEDVSEALDVLRASGSSWNAQEMRSMVTQLKSNHDILSSIRDTQLKEQLLNLISPIIATLNDGNYDEAYDALSAYSKEINKYKKSLASKKVDGGLKKKIQDTFKTLGEKYNLTDEKITADVGVDWNADADGDGVPDFLEKMIGTNVSSQDNDGDGYDDLDEILNGYNPLGSGRWTPKADVAQYVDQLKVRLKK